MAISFRRAIELKFVTIFLVAVIAALPLDAAAFEVRWVVSRSDSTAAGQKTYADSDDIGFLRPSIEGARVATCLTRGKKCGRSAADVFCQRAGFDRSGVFDGPATDRWVARKEAIFLGDNRRCEAGKCDVFSKVQCIKTAGVAAAKPVTPPKPKFSQRGNHLNLEWIDNNEAERGYRLEFQYKGEDWTVVTDKPSSTDQSLLTGRALRHSATLKTTGKTLCMRVVAYNEKGEAASGVRCTEAVATDERRDMRGAAIENTAISDCDLDETPLGPPARRPAEKRVGFQWDEGGFRCLDGEWVFVEGQWLRMNSSELLFREDFDSPPLAFSLRPFSRMDFWRKSEFAIKEISNRDDGHAKVLRVAYEPKKNGTTRLGGYLPLSRAVNDATLSFDVKLDKDFEFVKGGKMHGLSGGDSTTGCRPIVPNGFSVRMMWRQEGEAELYLYHQDREERCGDSVKSGVFLEKGQWHRINIYVRLNSGLNSRDGVAILFIDGRKVAERKGINFVADMSTKIDTFLFSTFYGGNDPSWSPSQTTHASYDNFSVRRGLVVTGG